MFGTPGDDGGHGRRDADANRERQRREQRESRRCGQPARRLPDIAADVIEPSK
jgi:hypothetical protein